MKKRILSLILALSMVLSVLPLGAFAEGSLPELVMENGLPDCSGGTSGNGWSYDNNTQTLTLTSHSGTYDFSSTHPQGKTPGTSTTTPVACAIVISSGVEITGGTFAGSVTNWSTISGGTFQNTCSVKNNGTIKDNGIFEGKVTNYTSGTILDGTFRGEVDNSGAIEKGTFEGSVQNNNRISGGTFQNGCSVTNGSTISGGTFQNTCSVTNHGYIKDGTFAGKVTNNDGTIYGGTFAGSVENKWKIYGGVFNGKTGLDGVTDLHSITVASGAKIEKVNDVPADWNPYVVVTQWTTATAKEVTIKANTEIYSLNGRLLGEGDRVNGNKNTVKFTMPGEPVVLNGAITCTDLVMEKGWPEASKDGQISCSGTDWSYDHNTGTLTLTSGTYDFDLANPRSTTDKIPADAPVACAVETQSGVEITGGTFNGEVANEGTIEKGTFNGEVENRGTIKNGTFAANKEVKNYGTIKNGTFAGNVRNEGTIENGTFEDRVINVGTIENGVFEENVENDYPGKISGGAFSSTVENYNGTIANGTFKGSVTNWGNITGGTFAGSVENKYNIYGGIFNGNTGLDGVTNLHSITVASGAKIEKVNGVSANWAPYVVTSNATTKEVTITADTEIFSLNGKPIAESSYGVDKKTVTFTMPDDDVVLNGAITSTDLVMENGWPKDSDGGTISCEGTGWSYDHITKTLTLTSGEYDFSSTEPVACAIQSSATITGGTFEKKVTNNAGGIISGGIFQETCSVTNNGTIKKGTFKDVCSVTNEGANATIENGTFKNMCRVINNKTIENGTFKNMCSVENNGTINNDTFTYKVENTGTVNGGVFNRNANLTGVPDGYNITVASNAKIEKVNGVSADWAPYVVTSNATTKEVTITADTEIFSLNGQPIAESNYGVDKKTVTFTMPDEDVVLNKAITSTDLVMENGWPKDSDGGKNPCKGDGWEYIPNDPTNGDMLLLTGSNQTGGLFDFSTIGDGLAVECNVFVGKPTAITGGEFNGKVINNSGILGGTFHGEVDNMGPGRIVNGTFKNSVENNGMIENGTFHDEVKNNGTINDGTFHGKVENNSVINSGTFNGEVDNTTMSRIENGTFNDAVENNGTIEKGTFNDAVKNNNTINDGTFHGKVENNSVINSGTFHGAVKNSGTINDGTFHGAVENSGTINGGVFNGAVTGSGTVSESITGSGTLNGEPITKTEPEPEPEPTTYTVTVIGGTIDGKTSVSAKKNDTLTVVLDQSEIPDGMTFDMWSISSSKLSGDVNVDYRAEAMPFKMPAEDVTIRAQYRSAEIIEDAAPSPLATTATIAVGGAAAGIVVWQGVSLGVDLYLANALPQGVPVPTDRRALALLLWETAGKPEVALPTLYGDIPTEEIELQKATRWAVQNGLMDAADKKDASFFDPDHYVTKMDVFGAWLRLKKLLGTT